MRRSKRLTVGLIWINFVISIFFSIEIAMKSYAFGLRRGFSQSSWVIKVEFFYQILLWTLWILFIAKVNDEDYQSEVNIMSLGILLRSLRVTALLNEMEIWRNFIRTIVALLKPFLNFSLTLYSLYLIYASIGLEIFGGAINKTFID